MDRKYFRPFMGRHLRLYLNPKEDGKQDETYIDQIRELRFLEYSKDGYVEGWVVFVGNEKDELYFNTKKYGNVIVPIDKVASFEELKNE